MHAPQLPGSPHLPTLGYLFGLILLAALGIWIWLMIRDRQQEG